MSTNKNKDTKIIAHDTCME